MRKLLKKAITLSLCACMMVGMATGASAAERVSENVMFRETSTGHYLNAVANSLGSVTNGTKISTWSARATDGTQDWQSITVTYNGGYEQALCLKGRSEMMLSYNRVTGAPVMWQRDVNNPVSEYAVQIWPLVYANQGINFSLVSSKPSLIVGSTRVSAGGQYGYYINTSTTNNSTWYINYI